MLSIKIIMKPIPNLFSLHLWTLFIIIYPIINIMDVHYFANCKEGWSIACNLFPWKIISIFNFKSPINLFLSTIQYSPSSSSSILRYNKWFLMWGLRNSMFSKTHNMHQLQLHKLLPCPFLVHPTTKLLVIAVFMTQNLASLTGWTTSLKEEWVGLI